MKKNTFSSIVAILLICGFSSSAQEGNTRSYTTEQGLAANFVYHVFQDSDKYIWFSTELGVSRFDGKHFQNFSFENNLPDNVIFETTESKNHEKWFLSGNGIPSYLPKNSREVVQVSELASTVFSSELLEMPNGEIVVASFGDGLRIKGSNGIRHINKQSGLLSDYVSFIWNDEDDIYALSTFGISRISQDGGIETVRTFSSSINFSRACQLSDGSVIFSAQNDVFLLKDGQLIRLHNSRKLTRNSLTRITQLSNGTLAACSNNGVQFFEISNDSIIPTRQILSDVSASDIILDHEQNYWVSTLGQGVLFFPQNSFTRVGTRKKAYCFYEDEQGQMLIGNANSTFSQLLGDEINSVELNSKNDYSKQKIRNIKEHDGRLWLMLDGGLASYHNGKTVYYRTGSGDVKFTNGTVHIANKQGYWQISEQFLLDSLIILPDRDGVILTHDRTPLLAQRANVLGNFRNDMMVGTHQGLFAYHNGQIVPSEQEVLSTAKISDLTVSDSTLVVSTFGYGVWVISSTDTIHFDESNGLTSNFCQTASIHENHLLVGTKKGLTVISDFRTEGFTVNSVTRQNGLPEDDINDVTFYNGEIWVATIGGVFKFNLKDLQPSSGELPLFLEEMEVNGTGVLPTGKEQFPHDENSVSFRFTPISFRNSDRVRMFYQLNNSTASWTEFKGNNLEFSALRPGSYTLKVKVKATTDGRNSETLTYSFRIRPPFWRAWWFVICVSICSVLLIYWFFRIRVLTYNRDVVRELLLIFIKKMKKEEYIMVKNVKDGSQTKVSLNDVRFIKAASNYVEIHLSENETIFARLTMKSILEQINAGKHQRFVQCHRSYIINHKKVTAIHGDFVKLGEETIPVGKRYVTLIQKTVRLQK